MKNKEEQNMDPVIVSGKLFEECEWVFQFDDDEPHIFAWTSKKSTREDKISSFKFSLTNHSDCSIVFTSKDLTRTFKLFARELSDEGRELRGQQSSLSFDIVDYEE